jgi:UDP-galactopyranose mutase
MSLMRRYETLTDFLDIFLDMTDKEKYDYLIAGAGFFGCICAHELHMAGKKVLVVESRSHIGGNCYTEERDGINIHTYGPHIFHTSNERIWKWINQFAEFNDFKLSAVANYKGEIYSLPFSMWTFSKMWGISSPEEAKSIIEQQGSEISDPNNLEEQAIKLVGKDIYEKLIKGYTKKQWMKDPKDLPKEIIKRLPVRFTYDNNYFYDRYQGIPIGGYTRIFEKLLDGIEVRLGTDYLADEMPEHGKAIFTGPIDRFFGYRHGRLEYKTTRFENKRIESQNIQGTAMVNYTDEETPYTRTIEHRHFEKCESDVSWLTYEYPHPYVPEKTEPYYPVNDQENNKIHSLYKKDAESIKDRVLFGGRLGEYKYYDMHQVIESALDFIKKELNDEEEH